MAIKKVLLVRGYSINTAGGLRSYHLWLKKLKDGYDEHG